ncbi:flagellar FliJ family protein [Hippea sp. KM1]|uniref:flagellar FliJ family protein n=1 Tax=Hippea sp. KM1 TaxID=944481 RepID=UPI00046D63D7|nr:flagellar FliJ family protein [Hippea sp. KM1]
MFAFKFEKLLKIKSRLLDEKRVQIALIEKEINSKKEKLSRLLLENEGRKKRLFEVLEADEIDRNMVMFLNENIEKTLNAIDLTRQQIEALEKMKQEYVKEAENLLKEKKKLEKLKEKAREEYRVSSLREEVKFLDEVANVKVAVSRISNN